MPATKKAKAPPAASHPSDRVVIVAPRKKLLQICELAARAILTRAKIKPVLQCLKIDAGDNRLTATGTNLECYVRANLDVNTEVPAEQLDNAYVRIHREADTEKLREAIAAGVEVPARLKPRGFHIRIS